MKANEAPDKIYVSNYSSGLTHNWHNERLAVNDIEYARTDAFIEKAIKYVANHFLAPGMDNEIKDFVNYMEGE